MGDISSSQAYKAGRIILQDKASCFSAYLLDPQLGDGDIIDACAAPGNKTTHLAALLSESRARHEEVNLEKQQIFACERDKTRAVTLQKMVNIAGAGVQCLAGQDFLRVNPKQSRWQNVGALLLDPSCSGSGIVGRDDESDTMPNVTLPRNPGQVSDKNIKAPRGKKRKRKVVQPAVQPSGASKDVKNTEPTPGDDSDEEETEEADVKAKLDARLTALSAFQLKIIKHSFSFPSAKKVVYSTCSIHVEENERTVLRALASSVAKDYGWRILKRSEQVDGMQRWPVRGDVSATCELARDDVECGGAEDAKTRKWTSGEAQEIADACLRCEKGTDQGTMGFFVVGFVRDGMDGRGEGSSEDNGAPESGVVVNHGEDGSESEDEFGGFSDG